MRQSKCLGAKDGIQNFPYQRHASRSSATETQRLTNAKKESSPRASPRGTVSLEGPRRSAGWALNMSVQDVVSLLLANPKTWGRL
ncbi:hypothetical protein CH063_09709 [Colletotrichum higginsianum]|uniref:Uncharacterized protein n=1 Tax=Colletotrichum higginsianum (strain IMI 349063) TaxID=759273 RepID=H1VEM6_COLHI|nr:hypothetical protein CH063_09709 [Colletotrichum higginsianum]